jgi:hypothetical protein
VYPIKIEGPTTKCRHIRNNIKIRPFEPFEFDEYPTTRNMIKLLLTVLVENRG